MKTKSDIIIISTGGTFNKFYNKINGLLEVDGGRKTLEKIFNKWLCQFEIIEIIGKDSLDISREDKELLFKTIKNQNSKKILIIHGTDTMDNTAKFLADKKLDKEIVLTGAMVPFSVDEVEATANLALGVGFLRSNSQNGVFIAMHSLVLPFDEIYKDRELGVFHKTKKDITTI